MSNLTKIQRVRLSIEDVNNLDKLTKYGISKSKFIREAIRDKFDKEYSKIIAEHKRKQNLLKTPF